MTFSNSPAGTATMNDFTPNPLDEIRTLLQSGRETLHQRKTEIVAHIRERYGSVSTLLQRLQEKGEKGKALADKLHHLLVPNSQAAGDMSQVGEDLLAQDAISETESWYKISWQEMIEKIRNMGGAALDSISSIASGALEMLKGALKNPVVVVGLLLIALAGGVYAGLELLQFIEAGGFTVVGDQLAALLGGTFDWSQFETIAPGLHTFFQSIIGEGAVTATGIPITPDAGIAFGKPIM